jgi:hypothetical protein
MYKISRFKDAGFHFVACIENKAWRVFCFSK